MSKSNSDGTVGETDQTVSRAVQAFEAGEPVLVHDAVDREGEVDLIYPAEEVTPRVVARLRNDAGGLICVALGHAVCETFGLPLLTDALDHPAATGEPDYDDRSSFSVTVNHRDTYTGITDRDRSKTIVALGEAASNPADVEFASTFRIPGHVHLLRGAKRGLGARHGHTELALALSRAADRPPAAVVSEMLDANTGRAMSVADARRYAEEEGFVFVEGASIVDVFG